MKGWTWFWASLVLLATFAAGLAVGRNAPPTTTVSSADQALALIQSGQVQSATWQGTHLNLKLRDGTAHFADVPDHNSPGSLTLANALRDQQTSYTIEASTSSWLQVATLIAFPLILGFAPMIVLVAVLLLILRTQRPQRGI